MDKFMQPRPFGCFRGCLRTVRTIAERKQNKFVKAAAAYGVFWRSRARDTGYDPQYGVWVAVVVVGISIHVSPRTTTTATTTATTTQGRVSGEGGVSSEGRVCR
jgi:hypothetical protein